MGIPPRGESRFWGIRRDVPLGTMAIAIYAVVHPNSKCETNPFWSLLRLALGPRNLTN